MSIDTQTPSVQPHMPLSLHAVVEAAVVATGAATGWVLRLNGDYKGTPVVADCYFSSVLNEKGGLLGLVSSTVQNTRGRTADTCKMLVETDEAATLNF